MANEPIDGGVAPLLQSNVAPGLIDPQASESEPKNEQQLLQKDFTTFLSNMVQKDNLSKTVAAESIASRKGFAGEARFGAQQAFANLGIGQANPAGQTESLQRLFRISPNMNPEHVIVRDQIDESIAAGITKGAGSEMMKSFNPNTRSIYQGEVPDNFIYNNTQLELRRRRLFAMYDRV